MLRSKWVMLCPMARSGSSHTCELLAEQDDVRCHHGLFNDGPFGRWPANRFLPDDKKDYFSSILDDSYARVGGEERSGEFLDTYIFTDDPDYNPTGSGCVGFKLQFVHFIHMPDLREYLISNKDIKIIVNTRRHLLEHTCAEFWCKHGNSRAARGGEPYAFGQTDSINAGPENVRATFRNLCRFRQYAIETFDDGQRDFLEWSYEDMFDADGTLNRRNHERLFEFLELEPTRPFVAPFVQTPRPHVTEYFANYGEVKRFMEQTDGGIFKKYFSSGYDPRADRSWPELRSYDLDQVMAETDNKAFRQPSTRA